MWHHKALLRSQPRAQPRAPGAAPEPPAHPIAARPMPLSVGRSRLSLSLQFEQ